jgi:hypothetical protein
MIHRALSLLLVVTLVLGWMGAPAFAGAACPSAVATVADGDACNECKDSGEPEKPRCPALACVGTCAPGPMISLVGEAWFALPGADRRALPLPVALSLSVRAIAPDLPPPR